MRPFLRWLIHGPPQPPVVVNAEWREFDPRTDALKAMAAALQAQSLAFERFAVASESVAAALERAERRALAAANGQLDDARASDRGLVGAQPEEVSEVGALRQRAPETREETEA